MQLAQQLLATFQGAQASMEKVTSVQAAERKEGGHWAPATLWVEGRQDMA